jgi:uncharacterized protein YabE (DUF348 family)
MKRISQPTRSPLFTAVSLSIALLLMALVVWGSATQASGRPSEKTLEPGQRIITVYDEGEKKVAVTEADTVGDALKQFGFKLEEGDVAEPAAKTRFTTRDFTVNIYRAKPVMIVDGMKRERIVSPHTSAKDIAKYAAMDVRPEDKLELEHSPSFLEDGAGTRLTIIRATPVTMVLYGERTQLYTQAKTVKALLKEKNISLGADDTISVEQASSITEGMTIEIWRNGVQTVTEEQEVPFTVRSIQAADKPVGFKEVQTPGKKGKKTVTFEVTMRNGQEVERKEIQSVVVESPSEQVEIVGAKPNFDGDFAAALAKLRSCEGGYNSWNPAGYYGAYQFDQRTWSSVADPAKYRNASPAEQDAAARALYERRGWQPWPVCGRNLPDTFR